MVAQIKALFNCTKCHYKTVFQTEMKRHNFKQHQHHQNLSELDKTDGKQINAKEVEPVLTASKPATDKEQTEQTVVVEQPKVTQSKENELPQVKPDGATASVEAVKVGEQSVTQIAGTNSDTAPPYKGDCLRCSFECNTEKELDIHMENVHQVPRPVPQAHHPDGRTCLDCIK